jgi:hypothetical protein
MMKWYDSMIHTMYPLLLKITKIPSNLNYSP